MIAYSSHGIIHLHFYDNSIIILYDILNYGILI